MPIIDDIAEAPVPDVDSIAYRFKSESDAPWHGLGTKVTGEQSLAEWLTAASLDWKVERRKVWMKTSREDTHAGFPIPNSIAIVRQTDNKVFGIFSDDYRPYQNEDVVGFFREYTEAGSMELDTLGSLKGGNIVWAQALIGKSFTLAGNDKVLGRLLLSNAFDGTMMFQGQDTDERVVCRNTHRRALKGAKTRAFKIPHRGKGLTEGVIAHAKKQMGFALESFAKSYEISQELSETKVDKALVLSYLSQLNGGAFLLDEVVKESEQLQAQTDAVVSGGSLLDTIAMSDNVAKHIDATYKLTSDSFNRVGRSILDAIVNSPGANLESAKDTLWGVVNGVSYYVDHEAGRTADSRLTNAWFGPRANLKDEAIQLAVNYARA